MVTVGHQSPLIANRGHAELEASEAGRGRDVEAEHVEAITGLWGSWAYQRSG